MKGKGYLAGMMAALMLLAGCSMRAQRPQATMAATAGAMATASPAPTPTAQPWATPVEGAFNSEAYSDFYRKTYGETVEEVCHALVAAVRSGAGDAACPDMETYQQAYWVLRTVYPLYGQLVTEAVVVDGRAKLHYEVTEAERAEKVAAFESAAARWISGCVCQQDTPAMAALALYHSMSRTVVYDHDAFRQAEAGEPLPDVSAVRAILTGEGICQSFAGAYAFLCLQLGIDAVPVGGLSADDTEAHEWVMVTLDGQPYYMDPTFENGRGGEGLCYFGMTAAQRALDNFPWEQYNIGDTNTVWGRDMAVTDRRFEGLWRCGYVMDLMRDERGMTVDGVDVDGKPLQWTLAR